MSLETFPIHPNNQLLACLTDTQGNYCGEEILKRVLNSEVFILLGEPAVGKSTVTEQIASELRQRDVPYEIVAYDNVLAEYITEKGIHEEGTEFNNKLVDAVVQARVRMAEKGGIVIFDTCAVGHKEPKDRSVTAVETLIQIAHQDNSFFSKLSILGIIAPITNQLQHARIRYSLSAIPSGLVVATLSNNYHISLEEVPEDIPLEYLGERIKTALRRSANAAHIARISHEVLHGDLRELSSQGPAAMYAIDVPYSLPANDQMHLQLRGFGMQYRARRLGLSDDEWLTVINLERSGAITWYADKYLRRDVLE